VVLAATKAIRMYVPFVLVFLSTPKFPSLVELSCQVNVSCAGCAGGGVDVKPKSQLKIAIIVA
jgi:hypothetical protein